MSLSKAAFKGRRRGVGRNIITSGLQEQLQYLKHTRIIIDDCNDTVRLG
jgi:hypothetical protein